MDQNKYEEIIRLRNSQLSPKQIARNLGLKPFEVNEVIREIAQKDSEKNETEILINCFCDYKSARSLLGSDDIHGPKKSETSIGLAMILLVFKSNYSYKVCTYLVDYWCLGLKSTIGPRKLNEIQYKSFLRTIYAPYDQKYIILGLKEARSIVFGAIDYAAKLGLKPDSDFEKNEKYLGDKNDIKELTFGRKGKPCYIAGPHDDYKHVMNTLAESIGENNFEFVIDIAPNSPFEICSPNMKNDY